MVSGGLCIRQLSLTSQTIERQAGYLEAMLRWMIVNTEQPIDEAVIMGASEEELVVHTGT